MKYWSLKYRKVYETCLSSDKRMFRDVTGVELSQPVIGCIVGYNSGYEAAD